MPINPTTPTAHNDGEATASIFVNRQSLQKRLTITGEIWIELNDFPFPSEHWSDFPVVILSWWIDALSPLQLAKNVPAECLFMDDPYSFEVSRRDKNTFFTVIMTHVAQRIVCGGARWI